ncbi:hypothetical protein P43SY_008285 [Pythium insidiosum]|uniref:Uncharacterized protein n=1 Tax=Pythium insidiosum TaxID=114742 RepID=A0AAD5MAC3_PYTIN|nr:hypothetical protein P43SY_008285 [Pythium insidiosum]
MEFPSLLRRLSSFGDDSADHNNSSPSALGRVAPTPPTSRVSGLTIDTSVAKSGSAYRKVSSLEHTMEPQWGPGDETPSSLLSRQATPTSTRSEDSERAIRRRRSNSECLFLAKNGADLPGPCKEYISSVKQILARTEENRPPRRRSVSLRQAPTLNDAASS